MSVYAGHTSQENGRIQPLIEHLQEVACKAGAFADRFGAKELGELIGLCHDIGKYSDAAQRRLLQGGPRVDHATAGGQELAKLVGNHFAYCVLGHHGGLPDGGNTEDTGEESTMMGRLRRVNIPDYRVFSSEVRLFRPAEPAFVPLERYGFSLSFLVRMLFSCLVDADFLDTERFMKQEERAYDYDDISILWDKLDQYIQRFAQAETPINRMRNRILDDCLASGQSDPGLFSLTVPTGGGKTISSLAFALAHAKRNGMERVIYVIPYTSIIEQNAAVFAGILGNKNIVEHHSNVLYDNEDEEENRKHLSTENWDAPIIVTTNVQFFESLFGNRTSSSRKLHNIANSVVIFDEAQMIPVPYLLPCVRAIAELVHGYRCTAVLCTATQPSLDGFFPKEVACTEICRDPAELYEFFRRADVRMAGQLSDQQLAERLNESRQALCIVNTRKQAQQIYSLLHPEGSYHLSTLMTPNHRKRILQDIRNRLKSKLPCRVVATSLIEAGVDVDFPVVYRASAGLDSIIQAAGRCNREGERLREESIVHVFIPEGGYKTPSSMRQNEEAFRIVAGQFDDITSLEAIEAYFRLLYTIKGEALDSYRIVERLEEGYRHGASFPFATMARQFRIIQSQARSVLIPHEEEAQHYAQRLRAGERTLELLRRIGPYCVSAYDRHFFELANAGLVELFDEQIGILTRPEIYDGQMGLPLAVPGGEALFADE